MFQLDDHLVCPACEAGDLQPRDAPGVARCTECEQVLSEAVLETLWQIRSLPNAIGRHACECGHPEMRHLPDGVFHCPGCGSEVRPLKPA